MKFGRYLYRFYIYIRTYDPQRNTDGFFFLLGIYLLLYTIYIVQYNIETHLSILSYMYIDNTRYIVRIAHSRAVEATALNAPPPKDRAHRGGHRPPFARSVPLTDPATPVTVVTETPRRGRRRWWGALTSNVESSARLTGLSQGTAEPSR